MATIVGVDACKDGWVVIELIDGRFAAASVVPTLADLPEADVVAVDIPIGFATDDVRRADRAAREFVGPRRASVFDVPPRAVWEAPTFAAANALCRELAGRGLSAQSYGLRRKVLEANAERGRALHEAHPEVSFRELAGEPLLHGKRTWAGQRRRLELLCDAGIELPALFLSPVDSMPVDDVLDAAAVAWTAARIDRGVARTLPADPGPGEPVINY